MPRLNAGDDSNPRSGEGGPRHTPAALAADPAFTGTYAAKDSPALTGTPTINGAAAATTTYAVAMAVALGG